MKIEISEAAAAALRAAGTGPLRIAVSEKFDHELWFDPAKPGDVSVEARGLTVVLDAASAQRAEGLSIDVVPAAGGQAFRIRNPQAPPKVKRVSAPELKAMIDRGERFELIDVRTPGERARARIEGARLLDQALHDELVALPKDTPLVFHCHHGMRSQAAAEYFLEKGFTNLSNLEGGIAAWSHLVDPTVPQY